LRPQSALLIKGDARPVSFGYRDIYILSELESSITSAWILIPNPEKVWSNAYVFLCKSSE